MKEPKKKFIEGKADYERVIASGANWFFWIAALSLVNSVALYTGANFTFIIGLFITQIVDSIGIELYSGTTERMYVFIFNLFIIGAVVGFGFLSKKKHNWAFMIGMITYTLDGLLALLYQDFLGAAFHVVALYGIYRGFQASKLLFEKEGEVSEKTDNKNKLVTLILGGFLSLTILFGFYVWVNPQVVFRNQNYYSITTEHELDNFFTYYYLNPQPELVSGAIEFIGNHKYASSKDTCKILSVFFSVVFSENEDKKDEWQNIIEMQNYSTKSLFLESMSKDVSELLNETKTSPLLNDMYWIAFFVTGDTHYIDELISNLKYLDERKDMNLFFTAWTAKWSLTSNAQTHPKVKAVILSFSENNNPELRKIANDMLYHTPTEIQQEMNEIFEEQRQKGIW